MTILQGQDAWHQLDRWHEPCDRPTYRTAVLELAPGLLTHGIAIAVAYDAANFLWNAADPDDQTQLENLWSGFVIEGSNVPFIRCGGHEFFVAFQPAASASIGQPDPEPSSPLGHPALIEACQTLLRLSDGYDDTGPVPLDDAIDAMRTALTSAAGSAVPDTSPTKPRPHDRRDGNAITPHHR
jgi:hypothetical protein